MELYELFIIAVSLSMDAFAVSICKGLSTGRPRAGHCLTCGAWFGGFQALMPLIGWLLGVRFQGMIVSIDHWIAFILLGMIGFNMVRESRGGGAEELDCSYSPRAMLPLAVATSIDALAVGVTFAFLKVDRRGEGGGRLRGPLQEQSGAGRRADSHGYGGENPGGAHSAGLSGCFFQAGVL